MIAYCRGERTGKVEQLKCVYVWERAYVRVEIHRNIAGEIEQVCVSVCVYVPQFDPPQQAPELGLRLPRADQQVTQHTSAQQV